MVVNTIHEIAGGGNLPDSCIGTARRVMGSVHQSKYEVLEEAVANHGPEVRLFAMLHNQPVVASFQPVAAFCSELWRCGTRLLRHCEVLGVLGVPDFSGKIFLTEGCTALQYL